MTHRVALRAAVLLLLFPLSHLVFAAPASPPQVKTYEQLISQIRAVRTATQQRIEAAVESEKVREAWETGRLIDQHILLNKERQNYGEQVIIQLAKNLGTSETELRYMLQFARTYPIHRPADELTWSHYQSLLALNDPKEREEVIREAVRHRWSRDQVREEVRRRQGKEAPQPQWEESKPGKVDTYRIVKHEGRLKIDLGFSAYLDLPAKDSKKFKEGDFVDTGFQKAQAGSVSESDLFTYQAKVTETVDGDTFHAVIDLGFGITLEQRLRLRQLDAPEIVSSEGKEAKEALEGILMRDKGRILLKTSKRDDQFGRYLVDVWVKNKNIDQELLDAGLLTVRGDA